MRCRWLVSLLMLLLTALPARADTPIALYQSYAGYLNFTGTQRTIRTAANGTNACSVYSSTTVLSSTLSIPAGSTVVAAQLYWAGSDYYGDFTIKFDGTTYSATDRYWYAWDNSSYYFAGAVDVTDYVKTKGSGTYTFSGLSVDNSSDCSVEGVLGGFSLLVIYSNPTTEPFRVLNLYEGFEAVWRDSVTLTLSNFKIPTLDNATPAKTARVGHITWEGDPTITSSAQYGEEALLFNGTYMYDGISPIDNQYNSASNINSDSASYGIDFDAYTVSSPIIQSGQTSATTKYSTGQDLVLLGAEIIAVPNTPVADVQITQSTTDSPMYMGQSSTYVLSVKNNGPYEDTGPFTVVDTVPSNLTVSAAGGSGWSCSIASQTVTCTNTSTLASGASLADIVVTVTPTTVGSGTATNTATVSTGSGLFDNVSSNNTSSLYLYLAASSYVFTDNTCVHGVSFGGSGQTCNLVSLGTLKAGTTLSNLYITHLNTSTGKPSYLHKSNDRSRDMYLGLACQNPTQANGVKFKLTALSNSAIYTCSSNTKTTSSGGGWVNLTFPGGEPTESGGPYSFSYADVGQIELFMIDQNGEDGASGSFVSIPYGLALSNIAFGATANPASNTIFVPAGSNFTMKVSSLASGGAVTPNFGRETPAQTFSLPEIAKAVGFGTMAIVPTLAGSFVNASPANGTATGSFNISDVGVYTLTPVVSDYLNVGKITGTAATVGRVYAHHFDTVVTGPLALCPTNMGCAGLTAAYALQPFTVAVTARNAGGNALTNYAGDFARQVTLSGWSAAGASGVLNPPSGTAVGISQGTTIAAASFTEGAVTQSTTAYEFSHPFVSTAPRALNWTAPTSVFVRATDTDNASSLTGSEGGVRIVAGRLDVANMYGSELLKMPVRINAQYWTGTHWENNVKDSVSTVTPTAANLECTVASFCQLVPVSTVQFTLTNGAGTVRLKEIGAGKSGRAGFKVNGTAWLPSTLATLVFGVYKSPVDYLREVY